VQVWKTAADSLGTPLLRKALDKAGKMVREGQPLSASLKSTNIFPPLAIDMMSRGIHWRAAGNAEQRRRILRGGCEHSYGGSPLADRAAIMIFMGCFVAFVLIALYLPIFLARGHY